VRCLINEERKGFAGGTSETEEGIDMQLALRYYSRWRFINGLLPLLRNARDAGEDARVMSVLAAGHSWSIDVDDLAIKRSSKYFGLKATLVSSGYNDYMMEEFALQEPGIAFTHIYPGLVNTPAISYTHWLLVMFSPIVDFLIRLFAAKPEDCAQYMWYGILEGEKGFFRRNEKGDNIGRKNYAGSPNVRKAIWDHSAEITDR